MAEYSVVLARSARKEIELLDTSVQSRALARIEALASNPRPHGCRKLEGPKNLWRIRVGEFRIVYSVDDAEHLVDIVAVRHRSDVYR